MVHDEKVGDYIHENQGRFVKDIVRLASQPSVSARKEGISECADIVRSMIEEIGGTATDCSSCPAPRRSSTAS